MIVLLIEPGKSCSGEKSGGGVAGWTAQRVVMGDGGGKERAWLAKLAAPGLAPQSKEGTVKFNALRFPVPRYLGEST